MSSEGSPVATEPIGDTEEHSVPQEEFSDASTPVMAKQKYRYDWYQTEAEVRINILIKKMKEEHVRVIFQEKSVDVHIDVGEGDEFNLSLPLAHAINVQRCMTKVYGTKIELRMRKCEGIHWEALEGKSNGGPKLKLPKDVVSAGEGDGVHKYPSSSHYARDWEKLVAEVKEDEKNEKPEGEAALSQLFQQIYEGGNDEVKKAMNKSFVESGGTVLSTNWGEIGNKQVDRQAPKGMEWKDYEK